MRIFLFAKRNKKEILRDPINLFFGLGFPLILLMLLSVINVGIPAEANNTMSRIENLAPGLAMLGTAFMALFSGMLLSKDRTSSFLMRLFASPMTSNVAGWLSGVFIPIDLIGGAFKKAADILPFYHSVQAIRAVLGSDFDQMLPHLTIVIGYSVIIFVLAIVIFRRKMSGDKA